MAKHTNMQRDVLVTNLEGQLEEIAAEARHTQATTDYQREHTRSIYRVQNSTGYFPESMLQ